MPSGVLGQGRPTPNSSDRGEGEEEEEEEELAFCMRCIAVPIEQCIVLQNVSSNRPN